MLKILLDFISIPPKIYPRFNYSMNVRLSAGRRYIYWPLGGFQQKVVHMFSRLLWGSLGTPPEALEEQGSTAALFNKFKIEMGRQFARNYLEKFAHKLDDQKPESLFEQLGVLYLLKISRVEIKHIKLTPEALKSFTEHLYFYLFFDSNKEVDGLKFINIPGEVEIKKTREAILKLLEKTKGKEAVKQKTLDGIAMAKAIFIFDRNKAEMLEEKSSEILKTGERYYNNHVELYGDPELFKQESAEIAGTVGRFHTDNLALLRNKFEAELTALKLEHTLDDPLDEEGITTLTTEAFALLFKDALPSVLSALENDGVGGHLDKPGV